MHGDSDGAIAFSAYELGERALAWIVEERSLRAALVPLVRMAGVPMLAPCTLQGIAWSPERALALSACVERVSDWPRPIAHIG